MMIDASLLRRDPTCTASWARCLRQKRPVLEVQFRSEAGKASFDSHSTLTFGQVVMCRLNHELTDPTTVAHQAIMEKATESQRSLWAYFLSRCSNRTFAERVVAEQHGRLQGATMRDMLKWACQVAGAPCELFNRHFQPQSRHYNEAKRMSAEEFLEPSCLRQTFCMSLRPKRISLKNKDNQWKSKRQVMLDMKTIRGNGPFLAKNQWRVLARFRKKPVPTDLQYSETGPGARRFLNILHGLPTTWQCTSGAQTAADAYNTLLLISMKELKAMLRLRIRRSKDEAEKSALASLNSELLQAPEAFQFWCCECWKLLNWIVTRKASYLRRSDLEQMVAEDDDDCFDMEWEEDSVEEDLAS